MTRHLLAGLAGLLFAAAAPMTANAATVLVRDNPATGPGVFYAGLGERIEVYDNGYRRVSAGVFGLQYSEDNSTWIDFLTFCLQIDEWLTLPKLHDRIAGEDYLTAAQRDALGILYGHFMTGDRALANATSAAAMQTLIWEIMQDGVMNFDLSAGSFRVYTDTVLTRANELWALAVNGGYQPVRINIFAAAGTQDLITSPVPIPAGLPILLTGMAALRLVSRRSKRARSA